MVIKHSQIIDMLRNLCHELFHDNFYYKIRILHEKQILYLKLIKHSIQYSGMDIEFNHMKVSKFRKIENQFFEEKLSTNFSQTVRSRNAATVGSKHTIILG